MMVLSSSSRYYYVLFLWRALQKPVTKKQQMAIITACWKWFNMPWQSPNFDPTIPSGCRSIRKWRPWRRVIIELSIKEPLFVPRLSVFFWVLRASKIRSPAKKNGAILWAGPPILAYPDFLQPFEIYPDASSTQLGAVITQDNRPIVFFSRKISKMQQNFSVTEIDLLAIVKQ